MVVTVVLTFRHAPEVLQAVIVSNLVLVVDEVPCWDGAVGCLPDKKGSLPPPTVWALDLYVTVMTSLCSDLMRKPVCITFQSNTNLVSGLWLSFIDSTSHDDLSFLSHDPSPLDKVEITCSRVVTL